MVQWFTVSKYIITQKIMRIFFPKNFQVTEIHTPDFMLIIKMFLFTYFSHIYVKNIVRQSFHLHFSCATTPAHIWCDTSGVTFYFFYVALVFHFLGSVALEQAPPSHRGMRIEVWKVEKRVVCGICQNKHGAKKKTKYRRIEFDKV